MKKNNDELDSREFRSNSDNPLLRFDAMTAGVKNGGLRSVSSINLLVCYIVANLSGKVKPDTITKADTKGAPIELIEKDLPLTVREQSIKLCQKIIAKEDFERENKTEITETDKGYEVTLHVSDRDTDFMRVPLFAASREQAEVIKDKFITNPVAVYETLIDSIFSNEE